MGAELAGDRAPKTRTASRPRTSTSIRHGRRGFTGIPAGASIDLWIADEGYLVAIEASGFPQADFAIQVTGIDDPANKVERPS